MDIFAAVHFLLRWGALCCSRIMFHAIIHWCWQMAIVCIYYVNVIHIRNYLQLIWIIATQKSFLLRWVFFWGAKFMVVVTV